MAEWQSIRTAPRDGTRVLAYYAGRVFIASLDPSYQWWVSWRDSVGDDIDDGTYLSGVSIRHPVPTHWMPLPPPPQGGPRD